MILRLKSLSYIVTILVILTGCCYASPGISLIEATINDKPILGMTRDEVENILGQPEIVDKMDATTQVFYPHLGMIFLYDNNANECISAHAGNKDSYSSVASQEIYMKAAPSFPYALQDSADTIGVKIGKSVNAYKDNQGRTLISWGIESGYIVAMDDGLLIVRELFK